MRETENDRPTEREYDKQLFLLSLFLAFLAATAWRRVHTSSSTFLLVASMYLYIYIASNVCVLSFHCYRRSRWHIDIDSHNEKESERKEARHDDHRSRSRAPLVMLFSTNPTCFRPPPPPTTTLLVNRGHWICCGAPGQGETMAARAREDEEEEEEKNDRGTLSMVNSCGLFENEEREIGM